MYIKALYVTKIYKGDNIIMSSLKGIFPALITPFTKENRISEKSLEKLVVMNLEKGVDGFYVGGSTGEAFLLQWKKESTSLIL